MYVFDGATYALNQFRIHVRFKGARKLFCVRDASGPEALQLA